ncbi:MAG: hypothetical protein COA78_36885 [Blastopirellula sp.]|nr:MAG: hypothetical protein COA78_36885 [Blastopirellula sp.]
MQQYLSIRYGFTVLVLIGIVTNDFVLAQELSTPVKRILQDQCIDCHTGEQSSGGFDLDSLINDFDSRSDLDNWVKIENAIVQRIMPPVDEVPLKQEDLAVFANWFDHQFVRPGGVQHAGTNYPRRLTREELQNTLEDILLVNLRQPVTNSRLHVIPDTIIEKFFTAGVHGKSGFSNDAETLQEESMDIQTYARCFSLVLSLMNEKSNEHWFGKTTVPQNISENEAGSILKRFGQAAFRRPLSESESNAFLTVYKTLSKEQSSEDAMKSSFLAMLLSPSFLYRFEQPKPDQTLVTGNELAVRLSYFLWSSPPDDILLELAAKRELRKTDVLKQQVKRMLADPRRIALAENLGGEWFDYKTLRQQSTVNKRSDKIAGFYRSQYEEALLLFDSMIRYDQPIFRLVDADWAFLNRHQSGVYGLQTSDKTFESANELPPINIHFRNHTQQITQGNYEYKHAPLNLVSLPNSDRGGFITSGPTLSVTSTENRTSPIRRGVWVLERILGIHFEPPKDVPDLEETQKKVKSQKLKLTDNEILKLHSSQEGCASCHKYIDPIGFGLEQYDQLGIKRNSPVNNPVGQTQQWSPAQVTPTYSEQQWPLSEALETDGDIRVHFQWTRGAHRLDVKNVRLESGEIQLTDAHTGFTGSSNRNNTWVFSVPKNVPLTAWVLKAEVHGDGGSDSHGTITISGPSDKGPGFLMPNGSTFQTPSELKVLLLQDYRDEIADNAIRRVLAYALGRQLEPIDRPAIQQIKQSIEPNDHRMMALIEAVVLSYPFRYKENP